MALSEEENVHGFFNFDFSFLVEECQEPEKLQLLADFDDSRSEKDCEDIAVFWPEEDSLPRNLLGRDFGIEAPFPGYTGWMDELLYEHNMLRAYINGLICFGSEKSGIMHVKDDSDAERSAAVDVIIFVLQYVNLGVKDLLSVERVCRSLRDAIRKDPYLWKSIHIYYPLSYSITDDDLVRLTDRAQGKLHCLSLENCLKISKDGLIRVLNRNLELTKLSVAGSWKLNDKGFLQILKLFNSVALPGIKHLRLGYPIGLTNEHLNEFKLLLGVADEDAYVPRLYRVGEVYLSLDDERAIDIDLCPKCKKVGQVYDCPAENCLVKRHSKKKCRGCFCCTVLCMRCGCCLYNRDFLESFYFETICFDCLDELVFLNNKMSSPMQDYFRQIAYHFFLYGG